MTADVQARIQRELKSLTWKTKLIVDPDAVAYYSLPSLIGIINTTDVLVLVPPGYPQSMLDYAFLPNDSPLRGIVKGVAEHVTIEADGRTWSRVSYHPHNGGGGPTWDPTCHGFNTYVDELLTWLAKRQ